MSVHPAFQRQEETTASLAGKNSRASSPTNSIVDPRRTVGHSPGLNSDKKGKGAGALLLHTPKTPEGDDAASSSVQPVPSILKATAKAAPTCVDDEPRTPIPTRTLQEERKHSYGYT